MLAGSRKLPSGLTDELEALAVIELGFQKLSKLSSASYFIEGMAQNLSS